MRRRIVFDDSDMVCAASSTLRYVGWLLELHGGALGRKGLVTACPFGPRVTLSRCWVGAQRAHAMASHAAVGAGWRGDYGERWLAGERSRRTARLATRGVRIARPRDPGVGKPGFVKHRVMDRGGERRLAVAPVPALVSLEEAAYR